MKKIFFLLLFLVFLATACYKAPSDSGKIVINVDIKPGEIRTFSTSDNEVCRENNKPIIRMFGTTWCPHCKWISPVFDRVVNEYKDKITAYHWNMDTQNNELTTFTESTVPLTEIAVYNKFNPKGSVPTFVFGCKYFRIGNGYESQNNLEAEETEFRTVIEKLLEE
ncbi:MAG TPA: thioredoxin family protein [Candidatus Nanoarchaeia archaeon]|nr:thioredoxin family protein [Candidatus Nanoarchaeia archaeon]